MERHIGNETAPTQALTSKQMTTRQEEGPINVAHLETPEEVVPLTFEEGINMQVARDLRPCAQILIDALNRQMWAQRRENGELD